MPHRQPDSDIRHGRSTVYNLHVHLVFVTKYRRPVFSNEKLASRPQLIRGVWLNLHAERRESNGQTDHVHLLVHYPPSVALSTVANPLKGVSSRRLPQQYPTHIRKYLWGKHFWSPSYFAASCAGAPPSINKQYIEQQNRPDEHGPLRGPTNRTGSLPAVNGQASTEEIK
jgi:putative transposase